MKLLPKARHLAFDAVGNYLCNSGIGFPDAMQVWPFVAMRVIAVAMGAVHQKQLLTTRYVSLVGCGTDHSRGIMAGFRPQQHFSAPKSRGRHQRGGRSYSAEIHSKAAW